MEKTIKVGSIVTDKRILYKFKRNGFIWDYSQWGYLENLIIRTKDDRDFSLYLSSNGNCKVAEKFDNAMWEKWRQGHAKTDLLYSECDEIFGFNEFTFNGMTFATKYVDGCFCPFLVRIE